MVYRSPWSIAALALVLVGCDSNSLHEDDTGYVDLQPFYRSGGTAADPTAGIPRVVAPNRGWIGGERVEFWDFGPVTVPRKLGTRGEQLRVPDAAATSEIYFFYDAQGRPLFAKPAFDPRSNTWFMPGGAHTLDPAPIDTPAAFSSPYAARPRAELFDDQRHSSSYQRPIIDLLPGDTDYGGVWEVVEITVRDGDYEVDDVKSAAKVREGIDDGKLSERRTGLVINCPVIDERTQVLPSVFNNNVPRPRIEVWYRTKLGNCFLANGWESIGTTLSADAPASDRSNLRLFNAGEAAGTRFGTLDVITESVRGESARVTVPIAKQYQPRISIPLNTPNLDRSNTRLVGDDVATALPRRTASDPGGYSPIVWMWDINLPQDPPYVPGTYRDVASIGVVPDPFPPANPTLGGAAEARDGGTNVVTRNIAVIGRAEKCVADTDCKFGMQCNTMPDPAIATTDPPPGQNIADVVIQREGGPRCDVPVVGFGGFCSPGVTRCDVQAAAGGDNEKNLKAIGVLAAGPTFTVHADLKAAQTKLDDTTSLSMGVDPANMTRVVTDAEKMTAAAQLPALQTALQKATDKAAYYDKLGFTKDLNGWGYSCYPGGVGVGTGPGFCAIRCDSTTSGTVTEVKTQITVPGQAAPVDYTFRGEARCGGVNMLGYRCLPSGTIPERQRVCVRECNRQANTSATYYVDDPAPTLAFNRALCDFPLNLKPDASGNPSTAFALSGDLPAMTAVLGQECNSASLSVSGASSTTVRSCGWNTDFVPRDPNAWPGTVGR
ncbi:MAG TPA: hypothetical protein VG937_24690 [Polyangiaceae bacterium]|nr:hypothetical protein [Polyangiaceae bacterium]